MYYSPKYFIPEEIFPKKVVEKHRNSSGVIQNSIWRLIDDRIIFTVDSLRDRFGKTFINNYAWGGSSQYRGLRPVEELIDLAVFKSTGTITAKTSSFTSQHCAGRAIDCGFGSVTVDDVREDIRKNPNRPEYKYITAVEEGVRWLHFDCRNWSKEENGIFFFKS